MNFFFKKFVVVFEMIKIKEIEIRVNIMVIVNGYF